ncbi:hypothetical protein UFOVP181_245 [uncultured Caudovirales phage]|uniref:Ig n=1 Tax=uncultured Caudovirales phage TaxID=2100421 RepID=A0A6J5KYJ7_9CAUD|nr:hypothetical protein UFOVP57_394 [uncultured Caudovirales phage]CAB5208917.1 hypothetical protein UFOVP181_245 [uncultured Caudovirales phage]
MTALSIWTQLSGYSFGTFQERVTVDQPLPVINDTGVVYTVISGKLPPGLRISGNRIIGTPYEVARETTFTFCIRAVQDGEGFSDRTFSITVDGADAPTFITAPGDLPIGDHQQYFVLDQTFIDFQIEAIDFDTGAGQHLSYFIARDGGALPPGLILTSDGRIVGFVQPALSIKPEDGDGTYDNSYYDAVAFDFAFRPTNGYDSYIYDNVFYDFSSGSQGSRKLNRNYEFIVTITDGDSVAQRKFKIFVVGDDYFRADNTTWLDGTGVFTADVTYLKAPVWITAPNLGVYRANNYVTVPVHTYDTFNVRFNLTSGTLPPGLTFDENTAELYGLVPYQPAITKTYTFTIVATRISDKGEEASTPRTFTIRLIGEIDSVITWNTDSNLGVINANFISTLRISATSTVPNASVLYRVTSGRLPPGLSLNLDGEIIGKVNQYPTTTLLGLTTFDFSTGVTTFDNDKTTVDRVFIFTVEAIDQLGYSAITRVFTITIDTPNQLVYSNIRVKPFLKLDQRSYWKDFINDTNIFTPNSIYRTNDPSFGLQSELSMLIYAGIETREAAVYVSAMGLNNKRKRFQWGSLKKATAYITGTNTAVYEVVYINMIDPLEPNGRRLPNQIKYLGKQTRSISVDNSNIFWTNDKDKLAIPAPRSERPDPMMSIDSTGYQASNPNPSTYYPNSITNWQERLKYWADNEGTGISTERNYLPLWMRSIQAGTKSELGFQLAVPLCYCKVGTADDIITNINHSTFDFKLLDYTADRYIIDSVDGETGDKYLVFKNDRITV